MLLQNVKNRRIISRYPLPLSPSTVFSVPLYFRWRLFFFFLFNNIVLFFLFCEVSFFSFLLFFCRTLVSRFPFPPSSHAWNARHSPLYRFFFASFSSFWFFAPNPLGVSFPGGLIKSFIYYATTRLLP